MKKINLLAAVIVLLLASPAWATTLNWFDQSSIEDGFIIEQNGPGGWTEIARVGQDVTTYVDALSTEGVYRVRAYRTIDGVDLISDFAKGGLILGPVTLVVTE